MGSGPSSCPGLGQAREGVKPPLLEDPVPYDVTLNAGLVDVALPGGTIAQGGQTYTLTDDQYLMLSPTAAATLFSSVVQTGGGGGGAVTSVNTQTGDVVLAAADVGAYSASAGTALAASSMQKSANLSDVANVTTARTSLGLTALATASFGTASGTAAQGNDSRITGAAQKASNLSDLASAATARTNLGLHGAAVLDVGTTSSTVASGDAPGNAVQGLWNLTNQGVKAWTFDAVAISSSGVAPTAGVVSLSSLQVYSSFTSVSLSWCVATAGSGLTAGQNFLGLYNSAGTLVWSLGVDTDPTTTGFKTSTMAVALTPGKYWVAALFNGTTAPALARCGAVAGSTAAINVGLSGTTLRSGINGTGATALPAPITLSNTTLGTYYWFAIQ